MKILKEELPQFQHKALGKSWGISAVSKENPNISLSIRGAGCVRNCGNLGYIIIMFLQTPEHDSWEFDDIVNSETTTSIPVPEWTNDTNFTEEAKSVLRDAIKKFKEDTKKQYIWVDTVRNILKDLPLS